MSEEVPARSQADYQAALRVLIAEGMVLASREPAEELSLVNRVIDIKRSLLSERALDYLIDFHKGPPHESTP